VPSEQTLIAGRYRLLRRLGAGAMGAVYEAIDHETERRRAIKVMHAHTLDRADLRERFRLEAKVAGRVESPFLVDVLDAGVGQDGTPFLVMELLRGEDLRRRLDRVEHFPPAEALRYVEQTALALDRVHAAGIVHRDLKPANLFLEEREHEPPRVKVLDFGIAKLIEGLSASETTSSAGTPAYMAPEQLRGRGITPAVDVYALGMIAFTLLVGAPYWEEERTHARDIVEMALIIVEGPQEPAGVRAARRGVALPKAFDAWFAKAAAAEPRLRFESAGAAARALAEALEVPSGLCSAEVGAATPEPRDGPVALGEPITEPGSEGAVRSALATTVLFVDFMAGERPDTEPGLDVDAPGADWASAAEQALRVGALDDAIGHAERALGASAPGDLRGHMRLVQAIAGHWLGRLPEAETWARQAVDQLPRGSTAWYSAVGYLALVCGALGMYAELPELVGDLSHLPIGEGTSGAHVMALSRITVQLARAGRVDMAQRLSREIQAISGRRRPADAVVRAWIDVATADLALNAGDLSTSLEVLESAVTGFAEAGDTRNASRCRANMGNTYAQLGMYDRAEHLLRDALTLAEPMKLHFIHQVRINLGFTIARLGRLEEALDVGSAALDHCVRFGDRRFAAAAHIYLAEIHRSFGDLPAAEDEARQAVVAANTPPMQAHARATLAYVLVERRHVDALAVAREAMRRLQSLGGIEEGESLIRLVYVLALQAAGDRALAADHLRDASKRLDDRANMIAEPSLRQSFLENVPEHARIRALVRAG
jgi:tetratricopeptide (TPR) repeat protein/tRNA A-37 threonylcarbamoyl transferase component Bud32